MAAIQRKPTLKQYINTYQKIRRVKSSSTLLAQVHGPIKIKASSQLEQQIREKLRILHCLAQKVDNNQLELEFYKNLFELSKTVDQILTELKKSQQKNNQNMVLQGGISKKQTITSSIFKCGSLKSIGSTPTRKHPNKNTRNKFFEQGKILTKQTQFPQHQQSFLSSEVQHKNSSQLNLNKCSSQGKEKGTQQFSQTIGGSKHCKYPDVNGRRQKRQNEQNTSQDYFPTDRQEKQRKQKDEVRNQESDYSQYQIKVSTYSPKLM